MKTAVDVNDFRIVGPLCGESIGHLWISTHKDYLYGTGSDFGLELNRRQAIIRNICCMSVNDGRVHSPIKHTSQGFNESKDISAQTQSIHISRYKVDTALKSHGIHSLVSYPLVFRLISSHIYNIWQP